MGSETKLTTIRLGPQVSCGSDLQSGGLLGPTTCIYMKKTFLQSLTPHVIEEVGRWAKWGPLHMGPAPPWSPMSPLADLWFRSTIQWAMESHNPSWPNNVFVDLHPENSTSCTELLIGFDSFCKKLSPRNHLIYRNLTNPFNPRIWSFSITKTWTGFFLQYLLGSVSCD